MKYLFMCSILTVLFSCSTKKRPEMKEANRFIEIRGKKQHIREEGIGEPAVVFITGGGSPLGVYDSVQNEISKITRTISYDRAGLFQSESLDTVRTIDKMAKELNELLEMINFDKPYILVGHSLGGHIARYYLTLYPEKVAGLVFIDPADENLFEAVLELRNEKEKIFADSLYHLIDPTTPAGIRNEDKYRDHSDSLMKTISFLTSVPIEFLIATKVTDEDRSFGITDADMKVKTRLYMEFGKSAPQINYIITNKSGHLIQLDEPELVINSIKSVVNQVRANNN